MAYIPGFEHDIFISYAHVDNLLADDDKREKGWIAQFHKQLEIGLAQRIGRMGLVKIWRDKKLEGDHLFDQSIAEGLEKSALFVAMLSNGYLASQYCCEKELTRFHQKASAEAYGLQIGDRNRIYAALINNLPHAKWPAEIGRISGHPFHNAEEAEDLGEPSDQSEKKFINQIRDLVDSLYKMLLAFKEQASAEGKPAAPTQAEKAKSSLPVDNTSTVFFAEVADSLRSTRARLMAELQHKGLNAVSGMPPPFEASAHDKKVVEAIGQSMLSVHLLDQFAGREMDSAPATTYPQQQIELAKTASKPMLIWVPKALTLESIEEKNHKEIVDKLENGKRENAKYDFVRGIAAELAPQILEKLEQLKTPPAKAPAQAVLLDTHLKDQLQALELSRYFLENNIQPYINPQEDDPNKNIEALEARLRDVSILMILYGSVNNTWVRQRLGAALQLCVIKGLNLKAYCVYSIPPVKRPDELNFNLGPIRVHLIDTSQSGSFDPQLLAPVLQSLREGDKT